MTTFINFTTKSSAEGKTPAVEAMYAENVAGGRGRLIQLVQLMQRESDHSDTFHADAWLVPLVAPPDPRPRRRNARAQNEYP
jgi:hypothetical protein